MRLFSPKNLRLIENVEKTGNYASIICAVHCLAMPILISLLPLIGLRFVFSHWIEFALMIFAVTCTLATLCWGYCIHKSYRAFAFLAGGICWIVYALCADQHHIWFSTIGMSCLLIANIVNRFLCKRCKTCECSKENYE